MDQYLRQRIKINFLKIGEMGNTAVLQIGTSGVIKRYSELQKFGYSIAAQPLSQLQLAPAVPLQSPVRGIKLKPSY
ncbi:spore gernimation protein [Bacillus sp. BRMEA1]|uniref:spore germination protein GerPB n=1 Tax=Neobacillus endophyticus TaxID=2738405 RepID=UPI001565011C|nr:spore germination protein GerPB [Neobacillus endophyticus]NRD79586.1 spore gernimation protein [Neobacillus endophyticus]